MTDRYLTRINCRPCFMWKWPYKWSESPKKIKQTRKPQRAVAITDAALITAGAGRDAGPENIVRSEYERGRGLKEGKMVGRSRAEETAGNIKVPIWSCFASKKKKRKQGTSGKTRCFVSYPSSIRPPPPSPIEKKNAVIQHYLCWWKFNREARNFPTAPGITLIRNIGGTHKV